jgi:hypothetical protein
MSSFQLMDMMMKNIGQYSKKEHLTQGEYFCSQDHLNYKLSEKETHSGYPEEHFAQPITYYGKK